MLLIAHRGVSARAPENTLPAFGLALTEGADGIETDVRLTGDGTPVLMHDDDIERTTGKHGCVSTMTLDELRGLDTGARFDWHEPLGVPTLEEFLDLAAGRTRLFLELKGSFCRGTYRSAEPVAHAVAAALGTVLGVTVSSFDPAAVAAAHDLMPGTRIGLGSLRGAGLDWVLEAAQQAGYDEVHVPEESVDKAFVDRAHDAGIAVLAWTVNDAMRARTLETIGVDGIFTDDPSVARAALEA